MNDPEYIESNTIDEFLTEGVCPYFKSRQSFSYAFSTAAIRPGSYELLISAGFRRNGRYFYQNLCIGCSDCIPIRVDVLKFTPTRSQRRALKKNSDVHIYRHPVKFDVKGFELFRKYCAIRHHVIETRDDYIRFLIESPIQTEMMRYYIGKTLVAIGWIDILVESLSSVYFVFDPDYGHRSLGVFSALKEIELCKELNKKWLQLGFWIKDNPKMSYKTNYKPYQLLINGIWYDSPM